MKIATVTALATVALGIGAAQSATVIWDGGDGTWQTPANWNPDGVPNNNDDITINNGSSVTYVPGPDFEINGGGSVTIAAGSSWSQSPTNWSQINGGTLTLNNGTFTRFSGGNLVLAFNASNNGVINATDSSINVGGEIWFGHVSNTGNQTAQMNLTSSTIDANGGVGIWFWDTDAAGNSMNLNIIGGGTTIEGRIGRRNSGGSNNSVAWETLWDEGILTYKGSNSGVFEDYFTTTGTAGTTSYTLFSMIPEPSTMLLVTLGALGLLRRRR